MARLLRAACISLGLMLFGQIGLASDLHAYSVVEAKIFREGPYAIKLELQVSGPGSLQKEQIQISSLKVKIRNEKASSEVLKIKNIRAFQEPQVYKDIETKGYSVSPGQWVTKFYRLPKGKRPLLSDRGFIEIAFDNFTVQFNPRERKFKGPFK
ncbi:MAG: hypothetical protein FJ117_17065 [Deltaproteobacteria bacterium]|nr:hypothetical protein [Deltaproteobacteria bacterium]